MRDKILIIKDILKIIISLLIIVTAIKSCSFAYTYTSQDCYTIASTFPGQYSNKINEFATKMSQSLGQYQSLYDVTYINVSQYQGKPTFTIYYFSNTGLTATQNEHNLNYFGIKGIGSYHMTQVYINGSNVSIDNRDIELLSDNFRTLGTGSQKRGQYATYNNNFGNITDAPWQSQNLLIFQPPITWEVTNKSTTRVRIPSLNIQATAINKIWGGQELASIEDSRWLEKIEIMYMYYDINYQDWLVLNRETLYDYNINGSVLDNFMTDTETNEPNWISYIFLNSNKFKNNMIFRVTFVPDEYNQTYNELPNLEDWFIVVNNNTIISSGELNETNTFSGDYLTQYQNEIEQQMQENENGQNTQEIINEINNVTNTINTNNENNKTWLQQKMDEWFKVESGDIIEIVESTISDIKMGSGEIAVDLQILNYIRDGEAEDFIISWENANPNLTIKGEPITLGDGNVLESMGYMIPSNSINFSKMERDNPTFHSVMVWERIIINLSILMIIANQFYLVILQLFGVATTEYGHNQEEKRNLQRAQETEKAKIRSKLWNANQEKVRAYERLARQKGWKK